jgi:hypothetical protein
MSAERGQAQDYRVVIWFDKSRPIETFRYQAYDLRANQYTKAVEDWLRLIASRYPGYQAYTRDVDLAQERGATDAQKVGSAMVRDLMAAAAYYGGVEFGGPRRITGVGPSPTPRPSAPGPLMPSIPPQPFGSIGRANFPPVDLSPLSPPFPVPIPYPRPHP